jgi:hypothetical protein
MHTVDNRTQTDVHGKGLYTCKVPLCGRRSHRVTRDVTASPLTCSDVDGRPPYWRYFFRAARVVLMEITLENGRK